MTKKEEPKKVEKEKVFAGCRVGMDINAGNAGCGGNEAYVIYRGNTNQGSHVLTLQCTRCKGSYTIQY